MNENNVNVLKKNKAISILMICMLVATSVVIVFPLTQPTAQAQVDHITGSAAAEDGVSPYDMDGTKNFVVEWNPNEDHIISTDYTVEEGYTLDIPALDFSGNPTTGNEITFISGAQRIDVYGTLLTHANSVMPPKWTAFMGNGGASWTGIWIRPGGFANIQDCGFTDATKPLRFFPAVPMAGLPASTMLSPGVFRSTFSAMGNYGLQLYGAVGETIVEQCSFTDTEDTAKGIELIDQDVTIKDCSFSSHGTDDPQLDILNSNAIVETSNFLGSGKPGSLVKIDGGSGGTVFRSCVFDDGNPGDYYMDIAGDSPLIENCTFITSGGELSVQANENGFGTPASPTIRQPTADYSPGLFDDTFDNSTMNATSSSNITLQWYMNVFVKDPDNNPIDNAPVWVVDRYDDPADPPSKNTDGTGWANLITVTELVLHNDTVEHFNPFNVSSLNNSMMGFAIPEADMIMSNEVVVTVPFNPVLNTPPTVTDLPTPSGIQSGMITIDFMLEDVDPSDDGNLSIFVEFSTDGSSWSPATSGPGSEFEHLFSNTLHQFIWDSSHIDDLAFMYFTTVQIRITPYDRGGTGPSSQTGTFTVDNEAPFLMSMPMVIVTNNTATISWTVHEPADAVVWYGLDPDLTHETSGTTGSTSQSVSLSGLEPGRNYTYAINSTDSVGNKFTSFGKFPYNFVTSIYIPLYTGWNMISLAPNPIDSDVQSQLVSITGQYDEVQIYDSSDPADPWKHYVPNKPFGNDLTDINPEDGVWIKMNTDAILEVIHNIPDPGFDPPYAITLNFGWNLVGYPSAITRTVDEALSGVSYDMVQTYDAASGQWYYYDGSSGNLDVMELGRGYWIHYTESSDIWLVPYI
jgi:hypothetical protein